MRLLLFAVVLAASSACVTERGVRKPVSVSPLSTRCEAGPVRAELDGAVRDRVRLAFRATERCEEQSEQVYEVEHQSRLPVWVRVALSVPAAAAVAVPIFFGLSALDEKPGINVTDGGEALVWVVLGPALLVGGGTFAALSTAQTTVTKETERGSRMTTRTTEGMPLEGVVSWPGLLGPPRVLSGGVLELTLEEAQGLDAGSLSLDGAAVTLPVEARDRLGFLAVCAEALRGFDAGTASLESEKTLRARLKRAEVCAWNGWSFADEVVRVLTPLVPPAPQRITSYSPKQSASGQ